MLLVNGSATGYNEHWILTMKYTSEKRMVWPGARLLKRKRGTVMYCVKKVTDDLFWVGRVTADWLYLKMYIRFPEEYPTTPMC